MCSGQPAFEAPILLTGEMMKGTAAMVVVMVGLAEAQQEDVADACGCLPGRW